MAERQILFAAPMIRALLDDRKTQTRRIVKGLQWIADTAPGIEPYWFFPDRPRSLNHGGGPIGPHYANLCPYGQTGDLLRVRENAWERPERTQKMMREGADTWPPYIYDADYGPTGIPESEKEQLKAWGWKRRPSIHLPRLGSRIVLEITAVRVERLQDITEADAHAEGCESRHSDSENEFLRDYSCPDGHGAVSLTPLSAVAAYQRLWESINGPSSWALNPWVWVIEFRRLAAWSKHFS